MAGQEMKEWLARCFSWMRHYRADIDLGDELKTHLEMQEEDYAALGISPSEARRRARLRLGSTPAIVENVRDLEFITLLEHAYHDFLFGLRALRKSPVFAATAIYSDGTRAVGRRACPTPCDKSASPSLTDTGCGGARRIHSPRRTKGMRSKSCVGAIAACTI